MRSSLIDAGMDGGSPSGLPWHRIRRVAQALWVVLIAAFVAYYLYENWTQLRQHEWRFVLHFCLIALLWGVIRKLIGGLRWVLIAMYDAPAIRWPEVQQHLRVYFLSSLATYLPGSLWYAASRIQMNRTRGVGTLRTSLGLIYESGLLVWSGALVGTYVCAAVFPEQRALIWLAVLVLAVGSVVFIHPRSLNALLRLVARALGRPVATLDIRFSRGLQLLALSIGLWISGGLSLFYVIRAIDPSLPLERLPLITSAAALAWTLGFLAPWAPSGLGVREGLLVWLLETWMAAPVAVAASVGYRVVTLVEDVVWAGIVTLSRRGRSTNP